MNSLIKKVQYVIFFLFVLTSSIIWSNTNNEGYEIDIPSPYEALLGAFEYTVENVSYEYSKGVIIIAKPSDTYTVKVKLTNGELTGEDVKVVGNSIKFNVFIEGQTIAVDLTVDGDVISGKSTSYDGTFHIQGKRQVEQY